MAHDIPTGRGRLIRVREGGIGALLELHETTCRNIPVKCLGAVPITRRGAKELALALAQTFDFEIVKETITPQPITSWEIK